MTASFIPDFIHKNNKPESVPDRYYSVNKAVRV